MRVGDKVKSLKDWGTGRWTEGWPDGAVHDTTLLEQGLLLVKFPGGALCLHKLEEIAAREAK